MSAMALHYLPLYSMQIVVVWSRSQLSKHVGTKGCLEKWNIWV